MNVEQLRSEFERKVPKVWKKVQLDRKGSSHLSYATRWPWEGFLLGKGHLMAELEAA